MNKGEAITTLASPAQTEIDPLAPQALTLDDVSPAQAGLGRPTSFLFTLPYRGPYACLGGR